MVMDEQPQVATTPAQQSAPPPPHCERIEPVVWLLFGGTILFAAMIIGISKWSPNDGQTFQWLTTVGGGFAGALWTKITGTRSPQPQQQATRPGGQA
jgi:hypothetical protein